MAGDARHSQLGTMHSTSPSAAPTSRPWRTTAPDGMIKQKRSLPKTLTSRIGDSALLLQSTKNGSSGGDLVRHVSRGALIEVFRRRVPRILTDNEAPRCRRKPEARDFQPIPLMFLSAAADRHQASFVPWSNDSANRRAAVWRVRLSAVLGAQWLQRRLKALAMLH